MAQQAITLDMLNPIMEISNAEATEMAVEERMGIAAVSELAAARVKKADGRGLELRHTSHIARTMCMPLSRTQDRFWSCVMQHRAQLAEAIWHTVGGLTQATELTLIKYTPSEAAQFQKVCICE